MDLNMIKNALYGFVCGLTEILPVSARAHSIILLKIFGETDKAGIPSFLIHLAILLAIYNNCQKTIIRISRAKKLSRIPKKRRRRPLDAKSLMDYKFWLTMSIPVILVYLGYGLISSVTFSLVFMAFLMIINGIILYIPQFFPGSNKDSRMLTRLEGALMGLGGALSVIPGFSGVGAALSVGSILGVDRSYALTMTLLMNMTGLVCWMVWDILAVISGGIGTMSVMIALSYILAAAAAYLGTAIAIRVVKVLSANAGYSVFAYYCWGVALFTFILNLMA